MLVECDLVKRWNEEMTALHLEVIYLLKPMLLSHILSEKFKLQFSFVLIVVSRLITWLMKKLVT
jgi:hypothetical protein